MIVRSILLKTIKLCTIYVVLCCIPKAECLGDIIYAINCGGDSHVDSHGIRYEKDPLNNKVGIASDHGKRFLIGRVPPHDLILYQTERYHTNTFGYDIPIKEDGDYVLVLKFSEVYFNAADQKVFDVVLNGDHTVVGDLDIFDKVGRGVAHDEYVQFHVSKDRLFVNEEESDIRGGKIRVEFIKSYKDNPKVNALYVMKGLIEDVPPLGDLQEEQEQWQQENKASSPEEETLELPKNRRPSGPKLPDPYSSDDSSLMLPLFIAIGAFIPVLFCLCKL